MARTQVEAARAAWQETQSELAEVESHAAFLHAPVATPAGVWRNAAWCRPAPWRARRTTAVAHDRLIVVRRRLGRVLTILGGDPNVATDDHADGAGQESPTATARPWIWRERSSQPRRWMVWPVNVKLQLGEQVKPATPLFVIVADHRPWIEANIKETDLTHVHVGATIQG